MRSRASLILFLLFVLLLIILANNGALGNLFTTTSTTPIFSGPTARPLVFATAVPRSGGVIPTAFAPTAFMSNPPTVSLDQSGNSSNVQSAPSGVVAPSGQCVVPNGWVAYTIQPGDTLALIAQRYNLTVQQLASANCMDNPDLIYADQVIAVPPTP
jgi:LysM repeat protein